jgi:hypothetical protein
MPSNLLTINIFHPSRRPLRELPARSEHNPRPPIPILGILRAFAKVAHIASFRPAATSTPPRHDL